MKTTNTTERANTFAELLQEYETKATHRTPETETDYTTALLNLATAVAYSVLKKCIETSQNKTLVQVKRDIAKDFALLDRTAYAQNNSHDLQFNQNGDLVQVITDKDLHTALAELCNETLGDGIDLVNDAVISIMQETDKAKERNGKLLAPFMELPYTTRQLKRKVWIKAEDSVQGWETVTTTPIQQVYKAVRRAIEQSRAVQTDARNGYTYLADISTDTESGADETIYRRFGKYADIGGYSTDINGKIDYKSNYTANEQTATDIDTLIASLELTTRQAQVLALRLSGYGYKAIATYLGIKQDKVWRTVQAIQTKATAKGLTPAKI